MIKVLFKNVDFGFHFNRKRIYKVNALKKMAIRLNKKGMKKAAQDIKIRASGLRGHKRRLHGSVSEIYRSAFKIKKPDHRL